MAGTSATPQGFANRATAKPVGKLTRNGRSNSGTGFGTDMSISKKIKEMYANAKPAAVLADWLGISVRTSERKLGGKRPYSAEELGHLLRSERGFEILAAVMAEAKPAWWRLCAPLMDMAEIRKMQKIAQRQIEKVVEEAIDANRDLTAAIARADALSIHDEDYMRPHLDALRTIGGVHDRAMASRRGKIKEN